METKGLYITIGFQQQHNEEQYRLLSYRSWNNYEVNKDKLARAGFFYTGKCDKVRCFFCKVMIGCWVRGDNPFIEHKIHAPDCPFINGEVTNNVPIVATSLLLLEELELLRKSDIANPATSNRNIDLMKLSAEQVAAIARHPDYADKNQRLQTFVHWPTSLNQTPEELSNAGFFYLGVGDEVKCFYCGGCLRNFVSNDNALNEHRRWYFSRCLFTQFTYMNLKSNTYKLDNSRPFTATTGQIQYLVDYMEQNESLRTEGLLQDRVAYVKAWRKLAKVLNDLDGTVKDVKGWEKIWIDYKNNQKQKTEVEEKQINLCPSSSNILTSQSNNAENSINYTSIALMDTNTPNLSSETIMDAVGSNPK